MTFRPRNAYYLRISNNIVLPLFLYLDERHVNWMSDVVLQHVLADLKPLIIPKLQAEKDVHFGSAAAPGRPGNKRGTVEVHRGETYQFAYFFRRTEPHSVVLKSRYFVATPAEVIPKPPSLQLPGQGPPKKQRKRKRAKVDVSGDISQGPPDLDEEEWSAEMSEEGVGDADLISGDPRPVRKRRQVILNTNQEGNEGNAEDMYQVVDSETDEEAPVSSANMADVGFVVEEEEKKPKPLLKMKYQSFPLSGHCLCVVAQPWPAEPRLQEMRLGTSLNRGSLKPPLLPSSGFAMAGQRARTPLFFPEDDGVQYDGPFAGDSALSPVLPLRKSTEDNHGDEDLMDFSQTLNATGYMHTVTSDDDMEGEILFGDADEVRELF